MEHKTEVDREAEGCGYESQIQKQTEEEDVVVKNEEIFTTTKKKRRASILSQPGSRTHRSDFPPRPNFGHVYDVVK
eukprot:scaffold2290_cov170-Amphora_coffeaeformis.AAC.5